MIEYPMLKHRYGVRRYDLFKSPRFANAAFIQLPFGAVYHYHSDVPEDLGPTLDDPFLKSVTRPMFIDYITELSSFKGAPRTLSVPIDPLRREHAKHNRTMRPIRNREAAFRDPKSVLIENYCLMDRKYRYLPGLRSAYNRWYNAWYSQLAKMAQVAEEAPQRQQFIQIPIPRQLLSLSEIRRAENSGQPMPLDALRKLDSPDQMTLIDFFIWLGDYREGSVLNLLSEDALKTINICWVDTGCWTFINLGDLDRWREMPDEEVAARVEQSPEEERASVLKALTTRSASPVRPRTLQKDFLNFLLQMASLRVASVQDSVVEEVNDGEEEPPIEETGGIAEETPVGRLRLMKKAKKTSTVKLKPSVKKGKRAKVDNPDDVKATYDEDAIVAALDDDEALLSMDKADQLIAENDERIAAFDKLTEELNAKLAEQEEAVAKEADATPETLEDFVVKQAETYAQKGVIAPEAYRRSIKLSDRYKTLPNPVPGGDGTLGELIAPALEHIALDERNPVLPHSVDGIPDWSMTNSTKDAMDQRYLKDFHHKNIARMAMTVQKAGIAVQNYKIDKVENHMDSYEVHTVKLVPVGGSPSTISFKVPVIKEDGSYIAGGVRYRMRNQRTD